MGRVAACLLVAALCVGPLVSSSAYAAPRPQEKATEDPTAEAERLRDEARGYFRTAGDTDLSRNERREARREAYTRLKEAKGLLDDWLDEHPEDTERFDALYVDIASMLYWVKKESAVGDLGHQPTPRPKREAKPKPEPEPTAPEAPPIDEPEVPQGPTPADILAEIEDYRSRFPGDVPGLHQRYSEFLLQFPDRSTHEYEQAMGRLEELDRRLKDVYRLVRDDDPDALDDVDDATVRDLIDDLSEDLESDSSPVRLRAARFLGSVGSGAAGDVLLEALEDEPEEEIRQAIIASLAKLGGRRICRRLAKEDAATPEGIAALEVFRAMVAEGGVNARIAGEFLVEYVREFNQATQLAVLEELHAAGPAGALGLAQGLDMAEPRRSVEFITHLGEIGDPRTATHLARYLRVNPQGLARKHHRGAREAILGMGKPAVRYLIPVLEDEEHRLWAAELLRRITGEKLDDKPRTWERWYRKNRRKLEE